MISSLTAFKLAILLQSEGLSVILRAGTQCEVSVYTCDANSAFLNCIGWRQPRESDTLTNFHTNRELIVSTACQATSAWKQRERWEWRGVESGRAIPGCLASTPGQEVLHAWQLACPEGFAHGEVSCWNCSTAIKRKLKREFEGTLAAPPQRAVFSLHVFSFI